MGTGCRPTPGPDRALCGEAKLIRQPHSAAAAFQTAIICYGFHPYPPKPREIVSHRDLGPWNTVNRDRMPIAFIEWDAAQPVDPLADLA